MAIKNSTRSTRAPKGAVPMSSLNPTTEPEIFGPAISAAQVHDLEEAATTEARGLQRRIVLMVMSKSAEELMEICDNSPAAYIETRRLVHAFLPHARALAEMAQTAVTRLMVADMREDASKEDAEAMALLKEGGAA